MTWHKPRMTSSIGCRVSSRKSPKSYEGNLAPLETDLQGVRDMVLHEGKSSLWVSPSGKIYGKTGLEHHKIQMQAVSSTPLTPSDWPKFLDRRDFFGVLEDSGFVRIYISPFNDLAIQTNGYPTSHQVAVIDTLNENFPNRKSFVIDRQNNKYYDSVIEFKETL